MGSVIDADTRRAGVAMEAALLHQGAQMVQDRVEMRRKLDWRCWIKGGRRVQSDITLPRQVRRVK